MEFYRIMGEAQLIAAEGRVVIAMSVAHTVRGWWARVVSTITRQPRVADLP